MHISCECTDKIFLLRGEWCKMFWDLHFRRTSSDLRTSEIKEIKLVSVEFQWSWWVLMRTWPRLVTLELRKGLYLKDWKINSSSRLESRTITVDIFAYQGFEGE